MVSLGATQSQHYPTLPRKDASLIGTCKCVHGLRFAKRTTESRNTCLTMQRSIASFQSTCTKSCPAHAHHFAVVFYSGELDNSHWGKKNTTSFRDVNFWKFSFACLKLHQITVSILLGTGWYLNVPLSYWSIQLYGQLVLIIILEKKGSKWMTSYMQSKQTQGTAIRNVENSRYQSLIHLTYCWSFPIPTHPVHFLLIYTENVTGEKNSPSVDTVLYNLVDVLHVLEVLTVIRNI